MKIKKFEKYTSDDFGYDYGGHSFVLARYKKGWNNFKGSFFLSFKNDEFVPCLVKGYIINSYDNLNIKIPGDNHTYSIEEFEIIEKSNEEIQNIIDFYISTKKYNL